MYVEIHWEPTCECPTVITDVREKQISNAKTIKSDNRFMWFTNLATSMAKRENILL